jgi:iron complex transport system ATP-binding protein
VFTPEKFAAVIPNPCNAARTPSKLVVAAAWTFTEKIAWSGSRLSVLEALTVIEFESNCPKAREQNDTNRKTNPLFSMLAVYSPAMPDTPALLAFQHVSVMLGGKRVLHDVSLRIGAGEHVAILGPNGCGKSTLIKTITRECYPLALPDSSLTILGRDTWNVFELRPLLGIVSNELMRRSTREISGREMVLSGFFSSIGVQPYHDVTPAMIDKTAQVLELLEVAHLADREMTEMSSGEAHRLLIGRALVHDPLALLLDEPSNSLDFRAALELRDILRKLAQAGTGILMVTHHLPDILPEIDRVILLHQGRIFADGSKQELLTTERLTGLFGLPVELTRRDGYYHLW